MFQISNDALGGASKYPKKTLAAHEVHDVVITSVTSKLFGDSFIINITVRGKIAIENLESKYQTCIMDIWTGKDNESRQKAIDYLANYCNTFDKLKDFSDGLLNCKDMGDIVALANRLLTNVECYIATGKKVGIYNDKPFEKGFIPKIKNAFFKDVTGATKFLNDCKNKGFMVKIDKSAKVAMESGLENTSLLDSPLGTPVEGDLPF